MPVITRALGPQLLLAGMLLASAAAPTAVRAQGGTSDSVVARVQRLAGDGSAAAARTFADSVLAASKEGSPAYVEALFARASVAASADSARKDYMRIEVDYSSSPRAEDALLRLAQMEIARGDRAAARQYLERLALEHPNGASRAQGAYWLGRVMLEQGEVLPACASLAEARKRVAPGDVELANQINYYALPCAAAQRAADSARADSIDKAMKAARADSIARADSVAKVEAAARKKAKAASRKTASKAVAPKAVPSGKSASGKATPSADARAATWSAQVAAYDTPEEAQRLASRLKDRGYETRVTGEKPFRVRIGRYARRADAVEMVAKLKDAKIEAIVVEAEKP